MKIGFLLPANFAVGNPANGVRAQAAFQADALERAGHEVVRMTPWEQYDLPGFDVIQFFQGGFAHHNIGTVKKQFANLLVFAPIIDSNESNRRYHLAAKLGGWADKIYTVPGVFREQALASDLVVCRSEHERERIAKGLNIPVEKTQIVLNGVNVPEQGGHNGARVNLDLPDEFLLHVSAYTQERKNVLRLVEAVGPTGKPLIIVGSAAQGTILEKLHQMIRRFPNVRLLGLLERNLLNSLYASCKVFCLPSIHEGTGLAALEAGSYGANVVITRHGGTPDYFRDFAEYVDPYDVGSIRRAVERAWEKPRTNVLRNHIFSNLTWDHSARSLIQAYKCFSKQ